MNASQLLVGAGGVKRGQIIQSKVQIMKLPPPWSFNQVTRDVNIIIHVIHPPLSLCFLFRVVGCGSCWPPGGTADWSWSLHKKHSCSSLSPLSSLHNQYHTSSNQGRFGAKQNKKLIFYFHLYFLTDMINLWYLSASFNMFMSILFFLFCFFPFQTYSIFQRHWYDCRHQVISSRFQSISKVERDVFLNISVIWSHNDVPQRSEEFGILLLHDIIRLNCMALGFEEPVSSW